MENTIILDTSVLIEILKGNEKVKRAIQELSKGKTAIITAITKYETLLGLKERDKKLIELIPCVDFGCKTARIADELTRRLKQAGLPASLPDTLIAAKAKEIGATLVTLDRDFQRFVPFGVSVVIL